MTRLLVLAVAVFVSGCLVHHAPAWEAAESSAGEVGSLVLDRMIGEGDTAFAARPDPDKVAEAHAAYRAALRYRTDDPDLHLKASRASLVRGLLTPGTKGAELLERAVGHAERALAVRNPELRVRAQRKERPAGLFDAAALADVPALIAFAEALMAFADRMGTPTMLEEQDLIRAATRRGIALDRKAQYGASDRLLATLESSLPSSAGAHLNVALDHFEAAVAAGPAYLPTRVVYAERYASRVHDVALWKRQLEAVVQGNPRALPDVIPENLQAQHDARRLLGIGEAR